MSFWKLRAGDGGPLLVVALICSLALGIDATA